MKNLKMVKASKKRWQNVEYREKNKTNKGNHHTKEEKEKISLSMKGKNKGKKNGIWKGNKVGYIGLHSWLKKNKSKSKYCEECKEKKKLELANIKNHKYSRNPDDYNWLCRSCHIKFDRKI
jgi:hypothetical protein